MEDPIKIAAFLSSYGGWGVAAICIVCIAVLFKWGNTLSKKIEEIQEKHIETYREDLKTMTTVMERIERTVSNLFNKRR